MPRRAFPTLVVKKFYEQPDIVQNFEEIRQKLSSVDASLTNKFLASLTAEIILFQEKYLGVDVRFNCWLLNG
jgi:hypothetical protein